MKILVFEYITGGGFSKSPLPESLLEEGSIILRALVNDLLLLDEVTLVVTRDWRLSDSDMLRISERLDIVEITQGHDINSLLPGLFDHCDAIWPIAPETDNILAGLCALVEQSGKILLNSSAQATACAGNKFQTYQCLSRYNIAAVDTECFSEQSTYSQGAWVLKPVDGVGCEGIIIINNREDFQQALATTEYRSNYIIQPYVGGKTLSLCCLFNQGKAWLLCCNEQRMKEVEQKFFLTECLVNIQCRQRNKFQTIIDNIATAIPGLWGYVGIDIIATEQQALVLEINPRLTTSYAGIGEALGINVAELVVRLNHEQAKLNPTVNRQISVKIAKEPVSAS